MHEPHLYEYAVIRVVPKVEREEFLNVGLILFCKRRRYIRMEFQINEAKFNLFDTEIGLDDLHHYLESFQNTAKGNTLGGRIGQLETPERFRWLTAVRSSVLQTSRPHAGLSEDLDETFEKLFRELVL
ncbi:DUF3037 domain-containing protein [Flavobacterium tegetincola]|uniref:DUF3037 domain-containing protein n=1 Tax=Flavobacterium tegetincola TaxID=150172 RepID=UPI000424B76B|nr:DUF3037 domain-containing protein [Flavobacterium tegetincola]